MSVDDRVSVTPELARRLIAAQFPEFSDLEIRPVQNGGWDNCSFHLGDEMMLRMPSAQRYDGQVAKDIRWLERLRPHLSVGIPRPIAMGMPGAGFAWHWGIYQWLPGVPVSLPIESVEQAGDLAQFLTELHRVSAEGGPAAGVQNFHRGGNLAVYDPEVRLAVEQLDGRIEAAAVLRIWEQALASKWAQAGVWVHGDLAHGNILLDQGRISAVIDFGSSGVGDPACDLAIYWQGMVGEARAAFRAGLDLEKSRWERARGWALWKALISDNVALVAHIQNHSA